MVRPARSRPRSPALHSRPFAPAVALAGVLAVVLTGTGHAAAQTAVDVGRPMAADAAIKVWNGGGSVRVEGWDADSLAVTGEVAEVAGGRFFLRAEGDVAKLGVEGNQAEVRGRLVVRVPQTATVWIRTSSADIVVRSLRGAVDINTGSGDVDVESRPETFYAESMAGELVLHLKAGIARARSGTGDITFTGTVADLALHSVSGTLDITAPELRRGAFTTIDGGIEFSGAVGRTGALGFETHSGDVTLRLPGDLDADFKLSTFEGAIELDYPNAARVRRSDGPGRRSVGFESNAGGAEIEVRSYSGSVKIRAR